MTFNPHHNRVGHAHKKRAANPSKHNHPSFLKIR